MLDDTIAAIATPLGEGGLAVIRISGNKAVSVGDSVFTPAGKSKTQLAEAKSHTLHYGHIARDGKRIDEVIVSVMKAPATFTCEDVVEISCHGGIRSTKAVLDAVLAAEARLALPGEFTKRAFLHGRIDLAQAEAVADLIHARTELALTAANEQLAGKLSKRINHLRDEVMQVLAHIEAHIDFPDEDIEPGTQNELTRRLEDVLHGIENLLATANEGQLIRRGIRVSIIGRPNAGKSSLLNQLLGRDRAIVTAVPGTTRDTVSEEAQIRGISVVFIDTAGIQESEDMVEIEGIRRSRESLAQADLVLHVIDNSEPLTPNDQRIMEETAERRRLIVLNKNDLPGRFEQPTDNGNTYVNVSCLDGSGIETLKDAIRNQVWDGQITAEMLEVMINSRHQEALNRANASLLIALEQLRSGTPPDLVSVDLRIGTNAIGEIVGRTTTEDLLDSIFSTFCLGK